MPGVGDRVTVPLTLQAKVEKPSKHIANPANSESIFARKTWAVGRLLSSSMRWSLVFSGSASPPPMMSMAYMLSRRTMRGPSEGSRRSALWQEIMTSTIPAVVKIEWRQQTTHSVDSLLQHLRLLDLPLDPPQYQQHLPIHLCTFPLPFSPFLPQ